MQNTKISRRSFFKVIGALAGQAFVIGAGGMLYAQQLEPAWVEITQVKLKLARLGKAFEGFRLLQISDIHMGGWMNAERFSHITKLAVAQAADLIALTGDFVIYHGGRRVRASVINDLSEGFNSLGQVPRLGILGNHDLRADPIVIHKLMEDHQIVDLTNAVHTIVRGEERLHFAGLDDMLFGQPDLNKVLAALPEDGCAILLAHEPEFADESARTGRFDLQISGHSHGGQVALPFIGPLHLPVGGRKYYSGLYKVGTMQQYTNRGVGMVPPYIRLNCRPEITVFTLERG